MSTQKNEHNPETTAQGPSQKLGPSAPLELQERGELVQRRKMCAQLQAEIDKLKRECAEQRSAASYNLSMQEAANKERDEAFKLLDEIRRITPLADTPGSGREGETPETDKATITSGNWPQFEAVRADFARKLERQRDAAYVNLGKKERVLASYRGIEKELREDLAAALAQLEALRRAAKDALLSIHELASILDDPERRNQGLERGNALHAACRMTDTLRAAIDSAQRQEAE